MRQQRRTRLKVHNRMRNLLSSQLRPKGERKGPLLGLLLSIGVRPGHYLDDVVQEIVDLFWHEIQDSIDQAESNADTHARQEIPAAVGVIQSKTRYGVQRGQA